MLALSLMYILLAKRLNIVDKPNVRSSHQETTVRGLGVLFPISVFVFGYISNWQYPFFVLAIFILGVVSFLDDIFTLSSRYRILIHLLAAVLILHQSFSFGYSWLVLGMLLCFGVGFLNAFNFMDGINGMTGVYGLVGLTSIAWVNFRNPFISPAFLNLGLIATVIFLIFNFRKKALAFCGDVGSISLGGVFLFIILLLVQSAGWKYLFFFTLYGVDVTYTILYRYTIGERIFEAHRLHFYQILVHEAKWPHLRVSVLYGMIQLMFNIWIINYYSPYIVWVLIFSLVTMTHLVRSSFNKAIVFLPNNK